MKILLLLMCFALTPSCAIEFTYAEDTFDDHKLHYNDGVNMIRCEWCLPYNF